MYKEWKFSIIARDKGKAGSLRSYFLRIHPQLRFEHKSIEGRCNKKKNRKRNLNETIKMTHTSNSRQLWYTCVCALNNQGYKQQHKNIRL